MIQNKGNHEIHNTRNFLRNMNDDQADPVQTQQVSGPHGMNPTQEGITIITEQNTHESHDNQDFTRSQSRTTKSRGTGCNTTCIWIIGGMIIIIPSAFFYFRSREQELDLATAPGGLEGKGLFSGAEHLQGTWSIKEGTMTVTASELKTLYGEEGLAYNYGIDDFTNPEKMRTITYHFSPGEKVTIVSTYSDGWGNKMFHRELNKRNSSAVPPLPRSKLPVYNARAEAKDDSSTNVRPESEKERVSKELTEYLVLDGSNKPLYVKDNPWKKRTMFSKECEWVERSIMEMDFEDNPSAQNNDIKATFSFYKIDKVSFKITPLLTYSCRMVRG